jgi:hypothetical protein
MCDHNWIRMNVDAISTNNGPLVRVSSPSVPVSVCGRCHQANIRLDGRILVGNMKWLEDIDDPQ